MVGPNKADLRNFTKKNFWAGWLPCLCPSGYVEENLKKIIYNLFMTVKNKQGPLLVSLELISSGEFLYLKTPLETNSRDSENGPLSNLFQA